MAIDKPRRSPARAPHDAYVAGDPIPAGEAVETDSESVWALWHQTHNTHEAGFAKTAPASISASRNPADHHFAATEPVGLRAGVPRPGAARPAAKVATLDDALLEARRNNRVCPKPQQWQVLFEMLPARAARRPAQPLVGASWNATPSISKRMCLREQLEWAEAHGALREVLAFLRQLAEEEWHHMGE